MLYVFESSLGYNCSIRLGKIHNFSPETLKYVLEVNHDLKVLNHNFKIQKADKITYLNLKGLIKRLKTNPFFIINITINI